MRWLGPVLFFFSLSYTDDCGVVQYTCGRCSIICIYIYMCVYRYTYSYIILIINNIAAIGTGYRRYYYNIILTTASHTRTIGQVWRFNRFECKTIECVYYKLLYVILIYNRYVIYVKPEISTFTRYFISPKNLKNVLRRHTFDPLPTLKYNIK